MSSSTNIYHNYIRHLKSMFPQTNVPLSSPAIIPQSQPLEQSSAIATAIDAAIKTRAKIIGAIVKRNF
jgi:hypothetical protein